MVGELKVFVDGDFRHVTRQAIRFARLSGTIDGPVFLGIVTVETRSNVYLPVP